MNRFLRLEDTVQVSELRHRLALGLNWIDALTGLPASAQLQTELEAIGPFINRTLFERHAAGRHALRYAALIRKLIDKTVTDAVDRRWSTRSYGLARSVQTAYDPSTDPRVFVPRRLRIALAFQGNEPAASPLNIRTPWAWPGAAYPFPSAANVIRGRVLRGPSLNAAAPLPWPRLFATIPHTETDFAIATKVAIGHGDDRGEFAMALQTRAVSGAQLSNPVRVRLWAFAPPAAPLTGDDPLRGLPLEEAGSDLINDVLRGVVVPPTYTQQLSRLTELRLGETKNDADTVFLFA